MNDQGTSKLDKIFTAHFTNGSGHKVPACYMRKVKFKYQHVFGINTRI